MHPPFFIRHATQDDLEAIVAIYNSTIDLRIATADLFPVTIESRIDWFNTHNPSSRPIWVMEDEAHKIVAWASFSDYKSRAAYHITAEISLYIHEDRRGQGLGKQFLNYCLAAAPALGIQNVVGLIFSHNKASQNLFAQFGFVQWGLLPDVCIMDGKYYSVSILGLALQRPSQITIP